MRNSCANKILAAGFRFIRADHHQLVIKVQSRGKYSHGWKILERGFVSKTALEKRMIELLQDEKTIEM